MFPNHQAKQATRALIRSGDYIQVEHKSTSYEIHRDYYQQYLNHQAAQSLCSTQEYSGNLTEVLGVPAVAIIPM